MGVCSPDLPCSVSDWQGGLGCNLVDRSEKRRMRSQSFGSNVSLRNLRGNIPGFTFRVLELKLP